ncbi:MAG: UPF0175 family protein [Candidatus Sumerlaeaceae bacterium]
MSKLEMELPPEVPLEDARQHLAMWLHQSGYISAGKAAEMLEIPYPDYIRMFGQAGGTLFNYPAAQLEQERKNWG